MTNLGTNDQKMIYTQAASLTGSDTNNTASHALARVTSGERKLVSTTAKIVLVGLDNYRSANHRVGANKFHLSVGKVDVGNSILISLNISKITNHSLLIIRGTMVSAEGVENTTSTHKALSEIAEDVQVQTVLTRGQTLDGTINAGGGLLLGLVEDQAAGDCLSSDNSTTTSHNYIFKKKYSILNAQ
jgi:hypothetical protein